MHRKPLVGKAFTYRGEVPWEPVYVRVKPHYSWNLFPGTRASKDTVVEEKQRLEDVTSDE